MDRIISRLHQRFVKRPHDTWRLDEPSMRSSRLFVRPRPDTFGRFAESFARFMGTGQFLVGMSMFVVVWISWNLLAPGSLKFDPAWFILLNLIFSTQASYAAPLILLAQNRQDDRDRAALQVDRSRDERNLADTEFLTREVASLQLMLAEMRMRDTARAELRRVADELGTIRDDIQRLRTEVSTPR